VVVSFIVLISLSIFFFLKVTAGIRRRADARRRLKARTVAYSEDGRQMKRGKNAFDSYE
jgi:hypothetical protein